MFGKGVYFADVSTSEIRLCCAVHCLNEFICPMQMMSKVRDSLCSCRSLLIFCSLPIIATHSKHNTSLFAARISRMSFFILSLSDNTGLLLLCEVAAKPFYEKFDAVRDFQSAISTTKASTNSCAGTGIQRGPTMQG